MDVEYKNKLLAKYKDIADKDLEEDVKKRRKGWVRYEWFMAQHNDIISPAYCAIIH